MSKLRIIGFGFLLTLAFSAYSAASAFASEGQWLVSGAALAETLEAEGEGELEFREYAEKTEASGLLDVVLCSYKTRVALLPGGAAELTDLLTLTKVVVLEKLEGEGLDCTVSLDAGSITDCKENTLALLWVANLSLGELDTWPILIVLVGTVELARYSSNLTGKKPGYEVECESLIGVKASNECTGNFESTLTNSATTPPSALEEFASEPLEERDNCTLSGEHTSDETAVDHLWALNGEEKLTTAVSE